MSSTNPGPEDQLTRTLTARAEAYTDQGGEHLELSSVLARAGEIRRGRRMRASIVMAAVLAIAVPVGITVLNDQPGEGGLRPAAPSPTLVTPTPPVPDAVARLPLGAAPDHSYVRAGVVHNADGSTHRLPAAAAMDAVTPYLGGYLAGNPQANIVTLYDGTGKVVKSGPGPSQFAITSDGVMTAYVMNGVLYSNPGSGMASGDGAVGPVDRTNGAPIGYLSGNRLLYLKNVGPAGKLEFAITGGGTVGTDLASLSGVAATDDLNNLVAGNANGIGTVISLSTHKRLWSSTVWSPVAFSSDGKFVAATSIQNTAGIAILDAGTGRVIASSTLDGTGIGLAGGPIFDNKDDLLFIGAQSQDRGQAILRFARDGKLTRATQVVPVSPSSDNQLAFSFPVGPQ